jgi:hypothetical protein
MNKEDCTKGGAVVDDRHIHAQTGFVYTSPIVDDDLIVEVNTDTRPNGLLTDTDKANLDLIAEAFNVLNETGYTPAELARQVEEMREALQALVDDDEADDRDGDRKRRYFENASEVLSKYQPTNA